ATLVEKYDNLLVIQTFSKSRALAGLRVGFALGNEQLIDALIRMKDSFNSYPVDRLALAGAQAAMEDTAYFKETTDKIITTRKWVTDKLVNIGFDVLPSATNFVFAKHDTVLAKNLYEDLRTQDILIRYFGEQPIDNYLRITIGTDAEMKRFIEAVEKLLK